MVGGKPGASASGFLLYSFMAELEKVPTSNDIDIVLGFVGRPDSSVHRGGKPWDV
jgi:hypothetical protein